MAVIDHEPECETVSERPNVVQARLRRLADLSRVYTSVNLRAEVNRILEEGPSEVEIPDSREEATSITPENIRHLVEMRAITSLVAGAMWESFVTDPLLFAQLGQQHQEMVDGYERLGFSTINAVFNAEVQVFRLLANNFHHNVPEDMQAAYQRLADLLPHYHRKKIEHPAGLVVNGIENGLSVLLALVEMIPALYERQFGAEIPNDVHGSILSLEALWPLLGVWSSMSSEVVTYVETMASDNWSHLSLFMHTPNMGYRCMLIQITLSWRNIMTDGLYYQQKDF